MSSDESPTVQRVVRQIIRWKLVRVGAKRMTHSIHCHLLLVVVPVKNHLLHKGTFFLFLAYSGLVYAAGRNKKNEKQTH